MAGLIFVLVSSFFFFREGARRLLVFDGLSGFFDTLKSLIPLYMNDIFIEIPVSDVRFSLTHFDLLYIQVADPPHTHMKHIEMLDIWRFNSHSERAKLQSLPQRLPSPSAHLANIHIITSDDIVPLVDLLLHLAKIPLHAIRPPLVDITYPRAALHEPLAAFFADLVESREDRLHVADALDGFIG